MGRLIKQTLIIKPNKKCPVGSPRKHWMDRVRDDLKRFKNEAITEDVEDREVWRAVVEAAKRLNDA